MNKSDFAIIPWSHCPLACRDDNSVCEAFFSILKQEEFYRSMHKSEQDLRRSICRFMLFYNTKRPHSLLRYRTPDAYEATYFKRINENAKT